MKKTIWGIILVLVLIPFIFAWNDCDIGCAGDSPACGAYINTNNDNLCDHGQEEPVNSETLTIKNEQKSGNSQFVQLSVPVVIPEDSHDLITGQELKTKTVEEIAKIYNISEEEFRNELSKYLGMKISKTQNFQLLHDNYGIEPATIKKLALNLKEESIGLKPVTNGRNYYLLPIVLIVSLLYFTTLFISKKGKLKLVNHRKIWNILLLTTFLISGLLGLLLAIAIGMNLSLNLPFNILKLHVYAGIPMVIISIFHILWHIPYLKKLFKFY